MSKIKDVISEKIKDFRWEVKVSHLTRLFQILTDVYGLPELMGSLKKMEGMDVVAYFPKMNQLYSTIKISNCHFYPQNGKSENAVSIITFNSEADEIIPIINDVIRTKASLGGLFKLTVKYLLPGKIRIGGSLFNAIRFIKCIMLGNHPMYQQEKQLKIKSIRDLPSN